MVVSGRDFDSATAAKRIVVIIFRETGIARFGCRCNRGGLEALQRLGAASEACRFGYRGHQRKVSAAYQRIVTDLDTRNLGRTHRHLGILFEALDKVAQQAAAAGDNYASGQIFALKSGKFDLLQDIGNDLHCTSAHRFVDDIDTCIILILGSDIGHTLLDVACLRIGDGQGGCEVVCNGFAAQRYRSQVLQYSVPVYGHRGGLGP